MQPRACVLTSAHPAFDVRIFHKESVSLVKAGYDVTLVAPHSESVNCSGMRIEAVPQRSARWQRMLLTTIDVYRRALRADADSYHFHDPELMPIALLLRATGKPVIYDVHEDLPRTLPYKKYVPAWLRKPLEFLLDRMELLAAPFFSGLIAATPEIAERFRRVPTRVAVVQNYPLLEEFLPTAVSPDSQATRYVAYVGMRITKARGAHEMVRAIGIASRSTNIRLKLVGSVDSPELLSELRSTSGWHATDYLGHRDRRGVAEVTQRAFAGLVVLHPEPNYINSHSVKLFEYMCAGIPVIASDFPLYRSIVAGSRCGLVVDPLDPVQIAQAIEYLCARPDEAKEMGARGRHAVLTRYNWGNEEKTLLNFYREIYAGARSRSGVKVPAT
jgi:glycosyltransferase involved in cell wall biosynthesis